MKQSIRLYCIGVICLLTTGGAHAQHKMSYITGRVNSGQQLDTITLIMHGVYGFGLSAQNNAINKSVLITDNGNYSFPLNDITQPVYFSLWTSGRKQVTFNLLEEPALIPESLLEPGDSIHVDVTAGKPKLSGRGVEKIQWQMEINPAAMDLRRKLDTLYPALAKSWLTNVFYDSVITFKMKSLNAHKNKISNTAYELLRADVIGFEMINVLKWIGRFNLYAADSTKRKNALAWYQKRMHKYPINIGKPAWLAASKYYGSFLYFKLIADDKFRQLMNGAGTQLAPTDMFSAISKNLKGPIRDKVLTVWLYDLASASAVNDTVLNKVLSVVQTPFYKKEITKMLETYGTGQPVLDASFTDNKGNLVKLSDFKGKVVFIDFWFTGCTGCVSVAKALPEVEASFEGNPDIVFVSLSIDHDMEQWLKSIDPAVKRGAGTYSYTHYTTPTTKYLYTSGTGTDNAFIKKYVPTSSYPHLLLIGKDQRVFSANPPRPDKKDGKEKLIQLMRDALTQ